LTESTQTKFLLALQKARKEFKPIVRGADNPYFKSKYATLDTIMEAINPALESNGFILVEAVELVLSQSSAPVPALRTELHHIHSGETMSSLLPLSAKGVDPQHQGAAITYARRYNITALLSLLTEDDMDGNDPEGDPRKSSKPATKSKPQFKKRED
jgi:hypothetical protein